VETIRPDARRTLIVGSLRQRTMGELVGRFISSVLGALAPEELL